MKRLLSIFLSLLFVFAIAIGAQDTSSSITKNSNSTAKTPRKAPFRANTEQIKQAQKLLKDRGFYAGEQTGKLDPDTRAGLRKFQTAETLKSTGTLNKVTLEKMAITLTDKQKAM